MPTHSPIDWKQSGRAFLKSDRWEEWRNSDLKPTLPAPPLEQPAPPGAAIIPLPDPKSGPGSHMSLIEAIAQRRTHRKYSPSPLRLDELSFALWATQGVHEVFREGTALRRTVPSGGARHPFESYLFVDNVSDLQPGLYRYLGITHQLARLDVSAGLAEKIDAGLNHQKRGAAVVFIWVAIPIRTEQRYQFLAPKLIALDAGHVCQNLYLAATALGAGVCAIDAYDQLKIDAAIGVDGVEEFTVYCATLGKLT